MNNTQVVQIAAQKFMLKYSRFQICGCQIQKLSPGVKLRCSVPMSVTTHEVFLILSIAIHAATAHLEVI